MCMGKITLDVASQKFWVKKHTSIKWALKGQARNLDMQNGPLDQTRSFGDRFFSSILWTSEWLKRSAMLFHCTSKQAQRSNHEFQLTVHWTRTYQKLWQKEVLFRTRWSILNPFVKIQRSVLPNHFVLQSDEFSVHIWLLAVFAQYSLTPGIASISSGKCWFRVNSWNGDSHFFSCFPFLKQDDRQTHHSVETTLHWIKSHSLAFSATSHGSQFHGHGLRTSNIHRTSDNIKQHLFHCEHFYLNEHWTDSKYVSGTLTAT